MPSWCVCSRVTPVSARISSRVDGEIYRSLSRERRSGYGTLRARSGSRERTEDRGQRSEERGRRADSSGPRARIPRPSPSPTGTGSDQAVALHFMSFPPCASISMLSPNVSRRLTGSPLWPDCLHPGQTAQAERGRNQKVGFPPFYLWQHVNVHAFIWRKQSLELCCFVRQRKVRRDMLSSPIVPERGRSRSREAYPQMARSSSRGRSLSGERRGSRNSSESSLVDMEEMAQTLFRWWDYLW